jgi:hypothetical protein
MITLDFLRIVAIADVAWLIFWIWRMTQARPGRYQDRIMAWAVAPGLVVLVFVLTCGFFI